MQELETEMTKVCGQRMIRAMGTTITCQVVCQKEAQLFTWLENKITEYEHRFSANDATSELMAVNRAAGKYPVKVHPELFELVAIGKAQSLASKDLLNIAIGPLSQLWRIGFKDARVPSVEEINHVRNLTDANYIELDAVQQTIFLTKSGMKLDLGALAKGYIADRLITGLKEQLAEAALLNLGGNIVTFGPCPFHADQLWRIGIRNPLGQRSDCVAIIPCRDCSVVTSGIYERVLNVSGKRYHHIFDAQTGYPVKTDIASLTIISQQSLDGEIWTTRLFGYSSTKIKSMLRTQQLKGIIVFPNGHFWST